MNASWLLSAPDGDVAWFGRSMEESWTSAGTALAATVAAGRDGAGPEAAARFRGLADSSRDRLTQAYGPVPGGYAFIPALRLDPRSGARALELYAGSPSFAGLTLLQVEWLIDALPATDGRAVSPASRPGAVTLGRGRSRVTAVRSGRTWFAVRAGRSLTRYPGDLRYDFGLVALKRRGPAGRWRDVMPLRPTTSGELDSAGPVLIRDGVRALPGAREVEVGGSAVTLVGGFRTAAGAYVPGVVRFRYVATGCGVRMELPALAGDTYEFSSFLRSLRAAPRIRGAVASDGAQRVAASPRPDSVGLDRRRYYSATDPKLRRARMTWTARRNGTITVVTCPT